MNVLRKISFGRTNLIFNQFKKCNSTISSTYDPPYLEEMKSKVPLYDTLNIQLKGYDYAILESYQKYLHNLFKNLEINVEDSWATPGRNYQILRYKPKSNVLDSEYKLNIYERNIQVVDLPSTTYPILLRLLEATTPEGVTLSVNEHQEWDEEIRYVPDKELIQLKTQLEDMGGSTTKKR